MERTLLTIIRHGQTGANLDGVWHGSTDTPLTDHGHVQAQRVAAYVGESLADARALYASPLQRTRHTAAPIGERLGLEVRVDPELREFDLGSWEGKTYADLHSVHRLWHHMKEDPEFRPHGGESARQVAERLGGALRRIHDDHPGERVIVVTHGGALSLAFAFLLTGDYREWTHVMKNCAVSELVLRPRPELVSFNHTAHLDDL